MITMTSLSTCNAEDAGEESEDALCNTSSNAEGALGSGLLDVSEEVFGHFCVLITAFINKRKLFRLL